MEYEKGNRTFFRLIGYDKQSGKKLFIHIPRRLETEILSLWKQVEEERRKEKELERELKEILRKYRDVEKIMEIFENLIKGNLVSTASSLSLKMNTTKAKDLFNEFLETLVSIYFEGVLNRLTILQVLYLLANLKDISQAQDRPEFFFKKGINTIIRVVRNERIPNPFGTLKNDFFLSGTQTPYDFLLSNFWKNS